MRYFSESKKNNSIRAGLAECGGFLMINARLSAHVTYRLREMVRYK